MSYPRRDHTWEIWADWSGSAGHGGKLFELRIMAPFADTDHIKFVALLTCLSLDYGMGAKIKLPRRCLPPTE